MSSLHKSDNEKGLGAIGHSGDTPSADLHSQKHTSHKKLQHITSAKSDEEQEVLDMSYKNAMTIHGVQIGVSWNKEADTYSLTFPDLDGRPKFNLSKTKKLAELQFFAVVDFARTQFSDGQNHVFNAEDLHKNAKSIMERLSYDIKNLGESIGNHSAFRRPESIHKAINIILESYIEPAQRYVLQTASKALDRR